MQRSDSSLPGKCLIETKNVKLSPKLKPAKKTIKAPNVTVKVQPDNSQKIVNNNLDKTINTVVKESGKSSMVNALKSQGQNQIQQVECFLRKYIN